VSTGLIFLWGLKIASVFPPAGTFIGLPTLLYVGWGFSPCIGFNRAWAGAKSAGLVVRGAGGEDLHKPVELASQFLVGSPSFIFVDPRVLVFPLELGSLHSKLSKGVLPAGFFFSFLTKVRPSSCNAAIFFLR